MAFTATITNTAVIDGTRVSNNVTYTNEGVIKESAEATSLNAIVTGTLSTRTDANNGTVTIAGHALTGGEIIDIYWDGGSAYGATVGTVSGDDVPFTTSAGDDLPVATTAVSVSEEKKVDTAFDGDEVDVISASLTQTGRVTFYDDADAVIYSQTLSNISSFMWYTGSGVTNPLTGDPVGYAAVSCKTTNGTFGLTLLKNSVE